MDYSVDLYIPSPANYIISNAGWGETTAIGIPLVTAYCDIYFGGDGSITGTVKEKHSPANTPLFRRVLLIDERSQQVIRETWSDATTGNFAFTGIKIGPAYSTLSLDHLHNYRAVIADNLSA